MRQVGMVIKIVETQTVLSGRREGHKIKGDGL